MLFLQQFNKIAVMDTIQIKDKRFTPFIPEERILKEVARVASEINRDLEETNPLFLSVLNDAYAQSLARPYPSGNISSHNQQNSIQP
jgi:hypoxanthine phosphoribosyltransferase